MQTNSKRLALASALLLASLTARATDYERDAAALLAGSKFRTAAARIDSDYDRIVGDIVALTEIEAPPFKEDKRARVYLRMLQEHGLRDVEMDEAGNVMGLRKGSGGGPLVVIAAHLDTVFPEGTDVKVRREGDTLRAPGIGDDTSSLPVLLAFVRAMDAAGFKTRSDILFVGDVGEEGPGDLRGMRYLFGKGKYKGRIGAFLSLEPGRAGHIINSGVGSKRYKLTFSGPGGHSFGAFGLVSPAFALGQAIVDFGRIDVPASPKTTFNVGLIDGGTSVNSIPFAMSMTVDMRSAGKVELDALEQQFLAIPPKAVAAENAARSTAKGEIRYQLEPVGDRPVGVTPLDRRITKIASAVSRAGGLEPKYIAVSTDANWPMSLGVEALTLGGGFESQRAHSLDEFLVLDKPEDVRSMSLALATLLMLASAK